MADGEMEREMEDAVAAAEGKQTAAGGEADSGDGAQDPAQDVPAGQRKSARTKDTRFPLSSVAFMRIPPSYAKQLIAAPDCPLGPEPPAERKMQHKASEKTKTAFLRTTWISLRPAEQLGVLARFQSEMPLDFQSAPVAWVEGEMGVIDKDVDPYAHDARRAVVKAKRKALTPAKQHAAKADFGRKRARPTTNAVAPHAFLEAGGSEGDWRALVSKSLATPGTKDTRGKSVADYLEMDRVQLVGGAGERSGALAMPAMLNAGDDGANEVRRHRRKFTSKTVDDAFRNGEFAGKRDEWHAMDASEQFRTLEEWRARHGVHPRISDAPYHKRCTLA